MKTKRIKKVFSSSAQVFHLWANQSQSDARQSGSRTRAYFEGKSAFSYGAHYEVGRIVTYKGRQVGIVNNTGYSHTTSKHVHEAYNALDGLMPRIKATTFNVRDALVEIQSNLIDSLMGKLSKRSFYRANQFGEEYDLQQYVEFNATCDALGHRELQLNIPQDLKDLINEHARYRIQRAEELRSPEAKAKCEAQRAKVATLILKKNAETIEAWRNGYDYNRNVIRNLKPQLIRIIGEIVQTSSGAEVSLIEAQNLMSLIEANRVKSGDTVGSFRFTEFNKETGIITIGCHRIRIDEARRVLGQVQPQTQLNLIRGGK